MANIEHQSRLRFVLDENVPLEVAGWLRDRRPEWEVFHVLELGLQGSTDHDIFQWAQANQCIIVTFDRDFTDRRNIGAGSHCGIVHLRIRPTTIEQTKSALDRLLAQTDEADLNGAVVVVGQRNIRVRRPSEPDN
ncbi:MAG: DUF5615 family PIN-like protein [Chloroflexi bacterium]|nr:DUF5615 family PIN-like protein [Chloroflexota bacterium]